MGTVLLTKVQKLVLLYLVFLSKETFVRKKILAYGVDGHMITELETPSTLEGCDGRWH